MKPVPVLLATLLALVSWSFASDAVRSGADTTRSFTEEEPGTGHAPAPGAPESARTYPTLEGIEHAVRHRARWYVLDAGGTRVHVLHPDDSVESFPIGTGPTSSDVRTELLLVHADTIVAFERRGGRVHLHAPDGRYLGSRLLPRPPCAAPRTFGAVSRPEGIVTLAVCPGRRLNTRAFAMLELADGESRIVAVTSARPRAEARVDPYFNPVLVDHPAGIAFGNAMNDCLAVHAVEGVVVDSVCHRWLPRLPLASGERSALARARRAALLLGARLASPRTLPPFDEVFAIGTGRYAYRAPFGPDARGRTLLFQAAPTDEGGRLPPSDLAFAAPGEALLAWFGAGQLRLARYALP